MAWREALVVFYNFLDFFAIFFLQFSILGRVGSDPNDNFYFLYLSAFPYLFWLKKKS